MAMTPRKRAQLSRGIQYAVLVVLVVALLFTADWGTLKDAFLDPELVRSQFPEVITTALKNTVIYTLGAWRPRYYNALFGVQYGGSSLVQPYDDICSVAVHGAGTAGNPADDPRASELVIPGVNWGASHVAAHVRMTGATPADHLYYAVYDTVLSLTLTTGVLCPASQAPSMLTWVEAPLPSPIGPVALAP